MCRLFGLDIDGNPQLPYMGRLFAARDAALGWGTLTSDGDAQQRWVRGGLGCDVLDTVAGLRAARRREVSPYGGVAVTVAALTGAFLSALALRAQGDEPAVADS